MPVTSVRLSDRDLYRIVNKMTTTNSRARTAAKFVSIACAMLALAGCKSPEAALVGKWNGPSDVGALTLNADKTFTQGEGTPVSATGTWSLAEDKVTLKIDKIANQPTDQYFDDLAKKNPQLVKTDMMPKLKAAVNAVFTLAKDGKTMSAPHPLTNATITYSKAPG